MHDTIAWTYELLDAPQQRLFQCLAIFGGGCSLAALTALANHVIGPGATAVHRGLSELRPGQASGTASHDMLLECLATLVEAGLAEQVASTGAARLVMLEPMREYALEQLAAHGGIESLRRQHAHYYLSLVEVADDQVRWGQLGDWLQCVEGEYENLRAALRWAHEQRAYDILGRLCLALFQFWTSKGYLNEGYQWVQVAVQLRDNLSHTLQAKLLTNAGALLCGSGDLAQARLLLEESLTLWRSIGDQRGLARALNTSGTVAFEQHQYAEARTLFQQVLLLDRQTEDMRGIACTLNNLGNVAARQADYTAAHAFFAQALEHWRQIGSSYGRAMTLANLGLMALARQEYRAASRCYVESLALACEQGAQLLIAYSLIGLANGALRERAGTPCYSSGAERAARHLACVAQIQSAEIVLEPQERCLYEQTIAEARAVLGEEAFAAAWDDGQQMTLEQVVERFTAQ